ncbi:MAG: hypothetical protein V1847_00415 [Candidatus Diapherotrites archaeon]
MIKSFAVLIVALLLIFSLASAITEQEINETKTLVNSGADCKSLSDSQLEIIGEYYMEQMHPGEAHELMHQMMELQEGSDAEKQFHINLARNLYCGESNGIMGFGSMMGMMPMMMGGQMGNVWNGGYYGYWSFLNILFVILLIGLIILAYLWIIKLSKNTDKGGKK